MTVKSVTKYFLFLNFLDTIAIFLQKALSNQDHYRHI